MISWRHDFVVPKNGDCVKTVMWVPILSEFWHYVLQAIVGCVFNDDCVKDIVWVPTPFVFWRYFRRHYSGVLAHGECFRDIVWVPFTV